MFTISSELQGILHSMVVNRVPSTTKRKGTIVDQPRFSMLFLFEGAGYFFFKIIFENLEWLGCPSILSKRIMS